MKTRLLHVGLWISGFVVTSVVLSVRIYTNLDLGSGSSSSNLLQAAETIATPVGHVAWMFYTGCSGSSYAYYELLELFSLFPHIHIWEAPEKEFLKNKDVWIKKNRRHFCKGRFLWSLHPPTRMKQALELLGGDERYRDCPELGHRNQTTIFLIAAGDVGDSTFERSFAALNVPNATVHVAKHVRSNLVDWRFCCLSDCFTNGHNNTGIRVRDAKGRPWKGCFARRGTGERPRFHISPDALESMLRLRPRPYNDLVENDYSAILRRRHSMHQHMVNETDERLTAWEYDFSERGLQISTEAFTNMLFELGIAAHVQEELNAFRGNVSAIVRQHLREKERRMKAPRVRRIHARDVENHDELQEYIRLHPSQTVVNLFHTMWRSS